MQAPTLAFSCSSRPPSNKTFPLKTTLPLDSLPMVPSPHEVPSRWDGTASCHSHPQLHQQTEKKKKQQNPQNNSYFSVWGNWGRKCWFSHSHAARRPHSVFTGSRENFAYNVPFLKRKYFNAQKKETAGKGKHLSLLVCSSYTQIVRQFESHFWDD